MNILKVLTPQRIVGNFGERAAAKHLKKNGYKILKTNYTALGNEIDIIAENRDYTVFVEVKTRSENYDKTKEPRPACAVNAKKQCGIISAARYYVTRNKNNKRIRFDIIEIIVDGNSKTKVLELKHLENAFNCNTAYGRR